MAIPKIQYGPASWGHWENLTNDPISTDFLLNDSNNKIGQVFSLPQSGTITHVGFRQVLYTGSPPDYQVSVETVAANRYPSGSPYGGSVATSFTPVNVEGWYWIALSTPATAVVSDLVAIVLGPTGVAPTASHYISVVGSWVGTPSLPTFLTFSTAWSRIGDYGAMALKYSDGTVVGTPLNYYQVIPSFDINKTPDEAGALFTVPFDCTVVAITMSQSVTIHNLTWNMKLYDASDNVLFIRYVPSGEALWDTMSMYVPPTALLADTTYRLTAVPDTTGDIHPGGILFYDEVDKAQFPNGQNFTWTQRTDGGAWTDTALGMPWMALWIEITP